MSALVSGTFTRMEATRAELDADSARTRLGTLRERLRKVEQEARSGAAQAEAERLAMALDDESFLATLPMLDEATSKHAAAVKAFNRCGRARGGGLTSTGYQRREERDAAAAYLARVQETYREHLRRLGVTFTVETRSAWGSSLRVYQRHLEGLRSSYTPGDLPTQVEHAEAEYERLLALSKAIRANAISDAKLRAFALYVGDPALKLLIKLAAGYSPKPKTVAGAKFQEKASKLFEAGLLKSHERGVTVTMLGRDLAEWGTWNTTASPVAPRPALSQSELAKAFTVEERKAMIAKARKLERSLGDYVPSDLVEVGLPEQGVSYRIRPDRSAVNLFLRLLGAHKVKAGGARLRRRKLPKIEPGQVLASETA